jgi:hypothetical protein
VASSASTSATLSSAETSKGQTWSVEVTPSDGYTDGPAGSDELEIGNTAPEITSVVVDPDPASASDELSCAWSFYDEDGDDDESTLEWTIDGSTVGTDDTLSGVFISGDEVVCTVTAYDGTDWGSSDSDSVTITNTAPEVTEVTLSPSTVYTNDTITASVSTDDAEGDSVSVRYEWYVDGTLVSETSSSLDGASDFDKNEEVYVVVTPDDGTEEGSALSSDSIIVSNSPPTAPEISITEVESDCMSIDFDGSDDIVEIGPLGLSSQWTAEGWVSWDPTQPGTLFWNECFAVGSNYSSGTFYLMHDDQCDGDESYYEDRTIDSSILADGGWHHLAVTYDGSFEVFIDGVSVGSATPSSDWHYSGPYAGGLGGQTGHSTSFADASVYSFRISDSVRYTSDFSPDDILESDSDTELMWVFGDEGASTIDDLSGNGNDGSVVDASWVEDCPGGSTGSGLICTIDVDSTDDDDDAISYTFEWDVDGTAFTDTFSVFETGDGVSIDDISPGETWTCTVTPNDGDEDGDSASTSTETSEPAYFWANTGSDSAEMVYGSCGAVSSTSATCEASTLGELIYINPSGAGNLERKTLGETHLGVTGGRGFSISFSSDGTEATWEGATGCGGDYLQTDTVDIYECVNE